MSKVLATAAPNQVNATPPGTVPAFPGYQVLELLGQGGMGQVYKARHLRLDRLVALKTIRADLLAHPAAVSRFLREARAAGRLAHPNIVRVYDAAEVGNLHFLAMEYVEGADLGDLVEQGHPLAVSQVCDWMRQAAAGLQHAHDHGLVHRDVKPTNLLRTTAGQIKVIDLGLALLTTATALTQHDGALGTVDYIAPEQVTAPHGVDGRADVYSLGCTLYHLLAGQPPFADVHPVARAALRLTHDPLPIEQLRPDLPPGLPGLIRKMMAVRRENRIQTAAEVATALQVYCLPAASTSALSQASQATDGVPRQTVPDLWVAPKASLAGGDKGSRRLLWLAAGGASGLGLVVVLLLLLQLQGKGSLPATSDQGAPEPVLQQPAVPTPGQALVDPHPGPVPDSWSTKGSSNNGFSFNIGVTGGDRLRIAVEGFLAGGKAQPKSITIEGPKGEIKVDQLDKVPAKYRAAVQDLLDEVAGKPR